MERVIIGNRKVAETFMEKEEYRKIIRVHLKEAYSLTDEKVDEILPRFLEMLAEHLAKLKEIEIRQDLTTLCRTGHSLKGALLNLGLEELAADAYKIENLCKNKPQAGDRHRLVEDLIAKVQVIF
ncbi:MAG: Hpt domain-containing protein [Desulfobulbaceae bacterium]|nr:Hpt domain-containing protein [Desulfobulbaceae bacterium]